MGYYDPYPLIDLQKPVCLIGFMGCEVHSIVYFISSLTGLPYLELDKQVEHAVGMSLAQLYLEEGETRWRELESIHLRKALAMSPARLICLGDGTLLNDKHQQLCLAKSELVYIRRPQQSFLERIKRGRVETPQRFPYWANKIPRSFEDLEPMLSLREPGYEQAHTLIDIGELGPLEAAKKIIQRFQWSIEHYP